jgi:hypothetical protein
MEQVYKAVNATEIKLTNFDEDLKSGVVIGSLLECYVGKLGQVAMELRGMKTVLKSETDY